MARPAATQWPFWPTDWRRVPGRVCCGAGRDALTGAQGAGDLTAAQVLAQFAGVVALDIVLNFANGERITLTGYAALVAGDLQFIQACRRQGANPLPL